MLPRRSALGLMLLAGVLVAMNLGGCPYLLPDDAGGILDALLPPNGGNGDGDTGDGDATTKPRHERIFTEIVSAGYAGTSSCTACHLDHATDLLDTGHWKWQGTSVNITGFEDQTHGKIDLINNFCIAVPSNEGRCAQCHPSYGWKANTPASFFDDVNNIDCFICHDTTGTYRKHPSANGGGGAAALLIDGTVTPVDATELQNVAYNVGLPSRSNCGLCHYYAGGGDNVKHGDLSSDLNDPTADMDVHMGGLDFACQRCHTESAHGIAGMALHSVDEGGASPDCTRCHGETNVHTQNSAVDSILNNLHLDRVACQTCHIPTFARSQPTKVEWYWSAAGEDRTDIPTQEGRPTYDKMKGSFVWQRNVQPAYRWYDGKWERKIIGVADTYAAAGTEADPVVIAAPTATVATAGAKIYPFKKMVGDQPADTVNKRLLVPHLFGNLGAGSGLEHPYWGDYDWEAALVEGTAYSDQPFDPEDWTVESGFAHTVMYLTINHEVAPKAQALDCFDCHGVPSFWQEVGLTDPFR
jgi:octaheme c-type cytochrome (tetrathionate reductase family)